MKRPKDCPEAPGFKWVSKGEKGVGIEPCIRDKVPDPWLDDEISDEETSDADCRDTLDTFLYQSLRKGRMYLGLDFDHLMQAVQRAISWYDKGR